MNFLSVVGLLSVAYYVLAIPALRDDLRDYRYHAGDKLGAVASETAICSRVGIDLLKAGGNAADAVSGAV
jgi:gamma-glutamyltranspeptidase